MPLNFKAYPNFVLVSTMLQNNKIKGYSYCVLYIYMLFQFIHINHISVVEWYGGLENMLSLKDLKSTELGLIHLSGAG